MSSILWFLLGILVASLLFLLVFFRQHKHRRERLVALSAYLEAASYGKETSLIRTEDEFSLLEDEIYKTVSELRIARERALQERHQQADNLADISHQLKTPLTSMSLMTQLLETNASAEQQEYIGHIESQLSRLNWLTSSLLTMSRLDAGAIVFAPVSISFEALSARAIEPICQLLEERDQKISIHGKEMMISCDPHWTAESLINLIKNCSEHIPPEGSITLTASSTPLYLQITVEDNGAGFEPDEIPLLFRRFFRGKNSNKDNIGIGLALSRGIIEGQGGILRAENRRSGGARFVIRFYP